MKQFVHVVGTPLFSPPGFGLPGRDGVADEKPDSGGEDGEDCDWKENIPWAIPAVFGVEIVRGILRVLGSPPRFLISLTEAADPYALFSVLASQLCAPATISALPVIPLRGSAGYR